MFCLPGLWPLSWLYFFVDRLDVAEALLIELGMSSERSEEIISVTLLWKARFPLDHLSPLVSFNGFPLLSSSA